MKGEKHMSVTNINIRVDSDVKSGAQNILASLGLDMTTAVNVFLRQVIRQRGIPFALNAAPEGKMPKPGCMKGKIWMSEDFNAPLEDFRE